jgi:transcription termination factor Rho
MTILDRTSLEQSPLADLHAIASELSIDSYRLLRRAELIDAILARQGGAADDQGGAADDQGGAADDQGGAARDRGGAAHAPGAAQVRPRRRRGRRGGRGRGARVASPEARELEPEERERRGRPAGEEGVPRVGEGAVERAGGEAVERAGGALVQRAGEWAAEKGADGAFEEGAARVVEGVVELLPNGSGFVRVSPPEPSDDDVYISTAQVRRCDLIAGDRVTGLCRPPRRSERHPGLIRIDTVNGRPAEELSGRPRFEQLPAAFPSRRFTLGSDDPTVRAIDSLTPIGRGSRVTIAGPPQTGKTEALRRLAAALAGEAALELRLALLGVRPEEVAEWEAGPLAPSSVAVLGSSADAQWQALEGLVEEAQRVAARGADAVVLIDTLDGLHPPTAQRVLAAARNLSTGGSLTVIATASGALGGETSVIALDPQRARAARFPSLDPAASWTMRPELLVGPEGAQAIVRARAQALADGSREARAADR